MNGLTSLGHSNFNDKFHLVTPVLTIPVIIVVLWPDQGDDDDVEVEIVLDFRSGNRIW